MDPRFLFLHVTAGILTAAFVIFILRLGITYYRDNTGLRAAFGAGLFILGMIFTWWIMLGVADQ